MNQPLGILGSNRNGKTENTSSRASLDRCYCHHLYRRLGSLSWALAGPMCSGGVCSSTAAELKFVGRLDDGNGVPTRPRPTITPRHRRPRPGQSQHQGCSSSERHLHQTRPRRRKARRVMAEIEDSHGCEEIGGHGTAELSPRQKQGSIQDETSHDGGTAGLVVLLGVSREVEEKAIRRNSR